MEAMISSLLNRFEKGALSRRDLVQGLAMLTAASSAAPVHAQDAALKGTKIDHISIQVSDMPRSLAFYQKIFGLTVLSEDQEHGILRLGSKHVIISIRREKPYGTVDHFGVRVENFNKDAVTQTLQQHGLKPDENWQYGYYVKDPDGVNVQLL